PAPGPSTVGPAPGPSAIGPASGPSAVGPAPTGPQPGGRLASALRVTRRSTLLIAVAVGAGCPAGAVIGGIGLFSWYGTGRLADVALVGLLTTVVVAGHAVTTAWAYATRPGRVPVAVTQLPYLVTYAIALVWIFAYRFVPAYVGWAAAVLVAASWLTVWYLRNPRSARRAVVYLAAIAALVAGNGGAAALIGWRQTNGFGLVGQRTPWAAMYALTATSCLSTTDFYPSGTRTVQAHCPSGPQADLYSGAYDQGGFGQQLCGEQPRAAFQVWWDRVRKYQVAVTLDFGASPEWQVTVDGQPAAMPRPDQQSGTSATMTLTVRVTSAFRPGDLAPAQKYPMRLDKDNETWRVTANRTVLGGWKVCGIQVADPIQATAAG
ncbi:MAG TPA: hypothetical protein VJT31_15825, partial [Rugosimonospora sp.]|nr:hypothetical protein [Rugosimonospora sp.]